MITSESSTLDYAAPLSAKANRRSILWTILALPTLVIPFLNFACDTSPVDVFFKAKDNFATKQWSADDFLPSMLAIGICLGTGAFVWRIRERIPQPTTTAERRTCITAAGLTVVGFIASVVQAWREMDDVLSIVALVFYLLALGLGVWTIVRAHRRNTRDAVVLACLLSVFFASAVYALILFAGKDARIGWYLTALVAPVTSIELIFLAKFFKNEKGEQTMTEIQPTPSNV